jgi:class 3 adenylate cyclase
LGARFCAACGAPLAASRIDAPLNAPTEAMRGERRFVTVLFCDIVGSSGLASRLDPEDYAALLAAYRRCCAETVARHDGHMVQYVGDGVLAAFGYPRAFGDDAERAVDCGLDLGRAIAGLARSAQLPGANELAARIGIEAGLVIVGQITADRAAALDSLVGTALNTAARLQQLAPAFGVLIGEVAHELVSTTFSCEALPQSLLTRLEPPTQRAFRVHARSQGGRVALKAGRAALVGRDAELRRITERWHSAQQDGGQVVLVSGEAGIGKSRLLREFLVGLEVAPSLIQLTCTPHGATTAFHAAIEAFRGWVAGPAGQGPGGEEAYFHRLAAAAGMPPAEAVSVLEEALGRRPAPEARLPGERRRMLIALLQAWLLGVPMPDTATLIMVEDLHWSDPSLIELLLSVAGQLLSRRGMLVATCRSGQVPPGFEGLASYHLALAPLGSDEASSLLDALSREPAPPAVRAQILARADGVPLFIEELALAVRDGTIPRTLQQAFAARLDALAGAKRLAQIIAVLGGEAELELLGAVSGLDRPALEPGLRRLMGAEILVSASAPGIAFRHGLLQQAAYESLLLSERRSLHAEVADLLEAERTELVNTRPELVAFHRAAASQHGAAVTHYAQAIRLALAKSALKEAEELVRRGLQSASALPWPASGRAELELRILLGRVLIGRRGYASVEVREAFERAEEVATALQEDSRNLALLRGLASFYQVRGPLSRARALCARLVTVAEADGDPWTLADALRRQAWNDLCAGRLLRAEAGFLRVHELLEQAPTERVVVTVGHDTHTLALANASWLEMLRNGATRAVQAANRAALSAEKSPHPISACYAFAFAAGVLQRAGEWDAARALAERGRALAQDKSLAYWVAMSEVVLGRDRVWRGDALAGRDAILCGLRDYQRTEGELLRPYVLTLLAEAEEGLGERRRAEAALEEAEQVAERLEAHAFIPAVLVCRASLMTGAGQVEARRAMLRRAEAIARGQGAIAVADAVGRDAAA